jgi:plasmid stabilization system protein ParE
MHELVFSPSALRKLDSTYDYIANVLNSPKAAKSTIARILGALEILKTNPQIGPRLSSRIDGTPDRFADTRFLVCGEHIAIYDCNDEQIQVLALYHGREDIFGRFFKEID